MVDLPPDIVALVAEEKSLIRSPVWDTKSDDRYYVFSVPLVITSDGTSNFQLRVKTSKRFVDRDAIVQLEFAPSDKRVTPLWRIEWRAFGLHTNKLWGPPGFELAVVKLTHEHRFDDNWHSPEHRMRIGNLPAARPINRDPNTLSEFLAFCGQSFRIKDIRRIEPPLITQDIFWTRDD
ncbi:hypothetical protein CIT26_11910 [Mesorhizobium temperatum]|uniref:Uncharacterized protein n=1 Tax=Mesorhizobium temperatum TaxID=241416 RepID=A0A271LPN6_9HYPH|nr:hypothetical protein CIT26_11910 [Mesorhizobium temperatum]